VANVESGVVKPDGLLVSSLGAIQITPGTFWELWSKKKFQNYF